MYFCLCAKQTAFILRLIGHQLGVSVLMYFFKLNLKNINHVQEYNTFLY